MTRAGRWRRGIRAILERLGLSDGYIGAGLSVLVVDSDVSVRAVLERELAAMGFALETARTLAGAQELLRVGGFDLVVMAESLPDGTGLDLAAHIAERNLTCESVLVTPDGDFDAAVAAMQLGVVDYLLTPFANLGKVRARLHRVVNIYRVKQENRRLVAALSAQNELLEQLSARDPVTQLFTHAFLQDALEREIHRASDRAVELSLVLLDVDDFKQVNQTRGHVVGDDLLTAMASLLRGDGRDGSPLRIRRHDIVARYGPDQFAVLLLDTDKRTAVTKAEQVRAYIAGYQFEARNLPGVTVSAGVAAYPDDGASQQELLDHVELALLTAKRGGRNRTVSYGTSLPRRHDQVTGRTETMERRLGALDAAIVRCDFDFVYQPIYRAVGDHVFGFEALVRPRDATLWPNPLALIHDAERTGRIRELGRSLREGSIPALADLPDDAVMFVNLHPDDINDTAILEPQPYLAPWTTRIVFEITEVARIGNYERLRQVVKALKERGYRVALDDLGAGYSGLNSLAQLEPDFVKLDMELVWGIEDSRTARLVRHVLEFANGEGIEVVAEGVETEGQRNALVALGCPLLQGYLLSRPKPLSAILGE